MSYYNFLHVLTCVASYVHTFTCTSVINRFICTLFLYTLYLSAIIYVMAFLLCVFFVFVFWTHPRMFPLSVIGLLSLLADWLSVLHL